MQGKINELATKPVGKLLWDYSLPGVIGMLVMALYNVVDRIFIGQVVGAEAIAGLAITFPLMNITTAIGVLVGVGSSSWVSILLGRDDKPRAHLMLGNAFTLTLINAFIYIAIFATWMDPILRAFGAGDITLPYAHTYMMWVLPGLLMTNLAYGFNNLMRASGYPVKAMLTMLIGAITNIVLDALFVLVMDWGMIGAAIATDIAMGVSAIFVLSHFFRKDATIRFTHNTFQLKKDVVFQIISIGAAPSVVNVASCFINVLVNKSLLAHGGDMAIGAAGIFVTYTSLLTTIIIGICMGLQPVLGYNYGAGLTHRLNRALLLAIAAASTICTVGAVCGMIWPEQIAKAFTSDSYLIEVTVNCLMHSMWAFPLVGFSIIATCLFQSIGASVKAIFLSLSRQVIFLIPLLIWMPEIFGVNGVWLSFPFSDILAAIVTSIMVWTQLRHIKNNNTTVTAS